jgi:hypothetical protein
MADNLIMKEGKYLNVAVTASKTSGEIDLLGSKFPVVLLTDRDSTSGYASVDVGPAVYDLSVVAKNADGNSAVAVWDRLYWDTGQSPDALSKDDSKIFFGYALETVTTGETATINVLKWPAPDAVGAGSILANALGDGLSGGAGTALTPAVDDTTIEVCASPVQLQVKALGVDTAQLAADAVDGTKIADDAVSLEHLDSGITPAYLVKFAGNETILASPSPDTTTEITCVGIAETDIVIAMIKTNGGSPKVNFVSYTITTSPGSFTLTTDTAPTADDIISWMVLRAAA